MRGIGLRIGGLPRPKEYCSWTGEVMGTDASDIESRGNVKLEVDEVGV